MSKVTSYIKVETKDFGKACSISEKGEMEITKGQKKLGNGWATFVARGVEDGWFEGHPADASVEDIRDIIQGKNHDTLKKEVEIPANGKGVCRKSGKLIDLYNKDNEVKWASWRRTRKFTTYPGDLAKVIKAGLTDELMSEGCVIGRSDILKKVKEVENAQKSACEKLAAALETAAKIYRAMDKSEKSDGNDIIAGFVQGLE